MSLKQSEFLTTRPFLSFTATQFLGAFNDNTFKQVLLLMAAMGVTAGAEEDMQGPVLIVFTIPFLLFSGYAGQLSEMYAKTSVMRLSKIGELVIMLGGLLGFWLESLPILLVVLFLMGSQSAFFGPAKYGIIPEMVADQSMVRANGLIQMTTIVAIMGGFAVGGAVKEVFSGRLYIASVFCVVLSIIGIFSVYGIPASSPNQKGTAFEWNPTDRLFVSLKTIYADKALFMALIAYTYFYFSGALVTLTVNKYGLNLLNLKELQTSLLLISLSCGVIVGSLLASPLQNWITGKWTIFLGAVGVSISEALLYFYGLPLVYIHVLLVFAGIFSGLYFVPIAAFMQSRPKLGQKGEILAAVNWSNFAGILFSSFVWMLMINVIDMPVNIVWLVLSIGLAILLIIMFPLLQKLDLTQPHDSGLE